ncbi:MAG: 1-deoxy-D-xylulose-5-phosphate synthase [Candidatus Omnitrophica bacterium]|nr:1-deoxy-D-xylulose-5-phosphate synthase [Candidatus Omnitrophota bacterium]
MLIETVNSPEDLKKIPRVKLPILASEIRRIIIDAVSSSGGHLASSLGVVELTIALHYCFQAPEDVIVWDVGHQCYAHKIITGRRDKFSSLRQYEGISGFPLRGESVYDVFSVGHSSTAVSLALGYAAARDLKKGKEKTIAIIGDGSLSGGMCFEALNNAGHLKKDLLVILNTNEMSISPAVGALSGYLNKIISRPIYNRFKSALEKFISLRIPHIGPRLVKLSLHFEEILKGLIVPGIFFEELGFRYFGPLDGHNLEQLIQTLNNLKEVEGPLLLHVMTKKGKGFAPAEAQPEKFHSAHKFNKQNGRPLPNSVSKKHTFTEVFSNKLIQLASKDKSIVAITAAMPEGTGLDKFSKEFPSRFFDVGIAEQHAVSFAAGLSAKGIKPVVAVYSTFLQRSYDQIIIDLALQNLNVVLAVDRAGIVGSDGVTHQGIFDIAFLRTIPNIIVLAPKDGLELEAMLEFAFSQSCPVAIRYPKSDVFNFPEEFQDTSNIAGPQVLKRPGDVSILALGSMVQPAFEAIKILGPKAKDIGLINARCAKPLQEDFYKDLAKKSKHIITVEEGILDGGFGLGVKNIIGEEAKVTCLGLPLDFIQHGPRSVLLDKFGLSPEKIAKTISEIRHKI